MKVGDKIMFYVFSVLEEGTITEINKDKTVKFIEVQTGTYFGEDDIIRIEDDYNRE